ncbi:MAG: hypothetical protein E2O76_18070 [Caldithrix sp.]|nr:MAG: hypothetical protein E2O77_06480 [Caldithrix sp.]TDI92969.1 MAG: hypothetical protein E2O76_18070 [Caldithrix sp.]
MSIKMFNAKCVINYLLIFFSLIVVNTAVSQNFDPPYPRVGQVYFYNPGQGAEIWKDHDLIIIRHKYNDEARKIKAKNPDVILLATNDYIVSKKDMWPDAWYVKDSNGKMTSYHEDYGLMNITNQCPRVNHTYGSQRFNEFLPRHLMEKTDYNYFDGTFFDYWAKQLWGSKPDRADITNDNKPDGAQYVNQEWEKGNQMLISNLRALLNKPVAAHEAGQTYLNGNGFEFWPNLSRKNTLEDLFELEDQAVKPVINFAEGYGYEKGPDFGSKWRADFMTSQIGGAYFGHDEGTTAHRFTFLHDEFEADLGHPLPGSAGDPLEIMSGVYARYFDKGAIIANVSGNSKTVQSSHLDGRGYWRFRGAQDPGFNNGQQFTSVSFSGNDGIMLFTEPTTLVTPIIIDNVKVNMTSLDQSPAQYTGNWTQVRWYGEADKSKTGYALGLSWGSEQYTYVFSTGAGEARYQPKINVSGKYEIFEWHPDVSRDDNGSPCSNVKLSVVSADGTTEKTIDQSVNYGKWNSLGVYNFNTGTSGHVVLKAPGGCTASSDAIQFVSYDPNSQVVDTHPPDRPRGIKVESN